MQNLGCSGKIDRDQALSASSRLFKLYEGYFLTQPTHWQEVLNFLPYY